MRRVATHHRPEPQCDASPQLSLHKEVSRRSEASHKKFLLLMPHAVTGWFCKRNEMSAVLLLSHRLHAPRLRPGTQTGGLRARAVVPVRRYRSDDVDSVLSPAFLNATGRFSCSHEQLFDKFSPAFVVATLHGRCDLECCPRPSSGLGLSSPEPCSMCGLA